uniref:Uncharacterized protein n=1 Tax=Leersia perrieri TaxID=77586 RepID=A0A0D9V458_9ORYZ
MSSYSCPSPCVTHNLSSAPATVNGELQSRDPNYAHVPAAVALAGARHPKETYTSWASLFVCCSVSESDQGKE